MSEKSHVSLEQRICQVCMESYDTGALLIDRRLRASLERTTTTGFGLCPDHQLLYDQGFIALVVFDPERSGNPTSGQLVKPSAAYRLGSFAHLKREVFAQVFNVPVDPKLPLVFVDQEVIARLEAMAKK
jgi:hypothetical protein